MTEVIMPKMGDGMEEGTLVEWLKKEGEKIKSGEIIGTIQTDKATLELEAPGSGTLSGLLINGGETVPVGKAIAAVLKDGESLPANWGSASSSSSDNGSREATQPTSGGATEGTQVESIPPGVEGAEAVRADAASGGSAPSSGPSRVIASPVAKKLAAELGVDLSTVKGTGPGGRIQLEDVNKAQTGVPKAAQPSAPAFSPIAATAEDTVLNLSKLRQITAQRTQHAKSMVPHFYVTVNVDVEDLMRLRAQFEAEESGKVSINDFVMRACVLALQQMPIVNATYQGNTVLQYAAIHLGMAVALEDGLTVPVIKNAHSMTLRQLSARAKELAGKARENKLHLDDLSGSTFTISNMGMLDVDEFIAIINEPNAAILAVSSVRKQVVATEDDEVDIRRQMAISASFDHRVVDGSVGAKFVNLVRSYLENPTRLLL